MGFIEKIRFFNQKLVTRLTGQLNSRQESQELLITLGGVIIVCLVILVISFSKPLTEQLSQTLFIEHSGEFSYQADARAGIYDNSYAQTGEPFFWDISDELHAEFTYQAHGVQIQNLQGSYLFAAYLMDEHGWKRQLDTGEAVDFTTYPITLTLDLSLDDIAEILNSYQRQTGVSRNNYFLVLEPQIKFQGFASGESVSSEFSPQLTFYITTSEFYLVSDDQVTLQPEKIESITQSVEQGGTLGIFSLAVPVKYIRGTSVAFLVVALAAFAIFTSDHTRMLNSQDAAGIQYRYGEWIVEVSKIPDEKDMVLINEFDQLAKMSELYDLAILHSQRDALHYYYLKAPEGYFYHCLGKDS